MRKTTIRYCVLIAAGLLLAGNAQAFDFGNMMNPSKWMGGKKDDDRYYDDAYGPGYGYPGDYGPGYGYGPGPEFGPGYGGPGYGYGEPGYGYGQGYGAPGYGGPGYGGAGYGSDPGYGWKYGPEYNAPASGSAPSSQGNSNADELRRLKERVRQLEQSTQQPPAVWGQPGYEYR